MTDTTIDSTGFTALGLNPQLVESLSRLGYEEPTPIQKEAIPPLLEGRDLLGQAATGTGKTAAFALPLLQQICDDTERNPRKPFISALILVPTRELAMQVAEAVHKYGKAFSCEVLPIYGGQSMSQQLRALSRGVDVVVATPGRALDHIRRSTLKLDRVRTVVLDEADEMLDMGFAEDLEAILSETPQGRQTALFSATIAPKIKAIAKRHLKDPVNVKIEKERTAPGEVPRVRQIAYMVQRQQKPEVLGRVLDLESPASAIIFCRTRNEVDELTETLNAHGYRSESIHGGLSQEQRDRVMRRFRDGSVELLIATDVAARGLDIGHLSHVFNYDVPASADAYVHRIGRTGRAGREGVAITLAEPRETRLLRNIEQHTRHKITVKPIPTETDLEARRLEASHNRLREAIEEGELDAYRAIVESLADRESVMDIAAAAMKIAHQSTAGSKRARKTTTTASFDEPHERATRKGKRERERERPDKKSFREGTGGKKRAPSTGRSAKVARIYVGVGRNRKTRPADIVGAIANETGMDARAIGSIEILDDHTIVEIPTTDVKKVITALRATTVRGQRVTVREEQ
jgi:ATP-dependent RNA helicase DeaD